MSRIEAVQNYVNEIFQGVKDLFSLEERLIIKSAIFHHSDKAYKHDEYDELLKECDVFQRYLADATGNPTISKRLSKIAAEFGIQLETVATIDESPAKIFDKNQLGNIAKELTHAWHEWAKEQAYCLDEEDGFSPQRGDIVLYH